MPDPEGKNASCTQAAKQGNKSFIIKGRGSSVVEQPIRNRQVVGPTPTLGSNYPVEWKRVFQTQFTGPFSSVARSLQVCFPSSPSSTPNALICDSDVLLT